MESSRVKKRQALPVYVPIGRRNETSSGSPDNSTGVDGSTAQDEQCDTDTKSAQEENRSGSPKSSIGRGRARKPRPAMQVYVPRARRLEMQRQEEAKGEADHGDINIGKEKVDTPMESVAIDNGANLSPEQFENAAKPITIQTFNSDSINREPMRSFELIEGPAKLLEASHDLDDVKLIAKHSASLEIGPSIIENVIVQDAFQSVSVSTDDLPPTRPDAVDSDEYPTNDILVEDATRSAIDESGPNIDPAVLPNSADSDSVSSHTMSQESPENTNITVTNITEPPFHAEAETNSPDQPQSAPIVNDDERVGNIDHMAGGENCTGDEVASEVIEKSLPTSDPMDQDETKECSEENTFERSEPDAVKPTDESPTTFTKTTKQRTKRKGKSKGQSPGSPDNLSGESESQRIEIAAKSPLAKADPNPPPAEGDGDGSDSWDAKFDDEGECLDEQTMQQLTQAVGKVKIKKPTVDYFSFIPEAVPNSDISLENDKYPHLLELYNFSSELQTSDLTTVVKSRIMTDFEIRWVDDTHAIGVFPSSIVARNALSHDYSMLKARPIGQAIKATKDKVKNLAFELEHLPAKERPQTSAMTARRLVANSLGLASTVSKEQRLKERQQLKEAKARKSQTNAVKRQIWEGDVDEGGNSSGSGLDSPVTVRTESPCSDSPKPVPDPKKRWNGKIIGRCAMDDM